MRVLVAVLLLASACGGSTSDDAATGGSSGSGASSGSGGSAGVGASGGTSGSGGSVGGSGGVSCGPIVPEAPCGELSEAECMAAHGRCVPAYDDTCCPKCEPGPCADCVSYAFWACLPYEESNCVPGTVPHCATTPGWACDGKQSVCPTQGSCAASPGCVQAMPVCPGDEYCPPECHPVTATSCGPACSQEPAPSCAGGVPELKDGAYTGFCISGTVCALAPACAPEPPGGLPCPVLGQQCNYGPACGGTFCTCFGTWECTSTPC